MGLFSLEKRRLWEDLIVAFQWLKGAYEKGGDRLFSKSCCRTRDNVFKLKEGRFRIDIRKKFFYEEGGETQAQVTHRNAPFLETFKVRLDTTLSNLF